MLAKELHEAPAQHQNHVPDPKHDLGNKVWNRNCPPTPALNIWNSGMSQGVNRQEAGGTVEGAKEVGKANTT